VIGLPVQVIIKSIKSVSVYQDLIACVNKIKLNQILFQNEKFRTGGPAYYEQQSGTDILLKRGSADIWPDSARNASRLMNSQPETFSDMQLTIITGARLIYGSLRIMLSYKEI
jgi:hypothetical protein